jgi:putative membrane protein
VSRGTQNTLLLLVGLSTVVMVIKGTYLHFVKPALLPWLIAAAVVLIALAVASIVRDLRQQPARKAIGIGHGWCGCCWYRSRLRRSSSHLRLERTASHRQR